MTQPRQASAGVGSGITLNAHVRKKDKSNEASQAKGRHPKVIEGHICIRRLAKGSPIDHDRRRADYAFLIRYFGYETEGVVDSMSEASDDHIFACLERRRLEKEAVN